MIVYGSGGKELGSKKLLNETCPYCKGHNTIYIHGVARYAHVFWIPLFPISKKTIVVCHNCDKEISEETYSPILKEKVELEKSSFSTPIYFFSGLVLIGLAIGWSKYDNKRHDDFVKNRIYAMQIDDVLVVEGEGEYSFIKIDSLAENEYFFRLSNYVFDQIPKQSDYRKGLREHIDFYANDIYRITPAELDSINSRGELNIFE